MDAVDAVDNDDGDDEIWMYTFYLVSIGFALFHLINEKLNYARDRLNGELWQD